MDAVSQSIRDVQNNNTDAIYRGHQYGETRLLDNSSVVQGDVFNGPTFTIASAATSIAAQGSQPSDEEASQAFIQSLHYPYIKERFSRISEAHDETFRWALEDDIDTSPEYSAYRDWMSNDDAGYLFYIQGKPGSGKSTLMKHLISSIAKKTSICTINNSPYIVAQHCFWIGGTASQKSIIGMLHSLLSDILTLFPVMSQQVDTSRWMACKTQTGKSTQDWTIPELVETLSEAFRSLAARGMRLLAFVDGLDEIEGTNLDRNRLVDILQGFARFENVRLCVASRPWPIFADAFRSRPTIRLEDMTRNDIENYVNAMFRNSFAFHTMEQLNPPRTKKLTSSIVSQAQGVFLWVSLVTQDLLRAMQDGTSIANLEDILDKIPPDLNDYFFKYV